MYKARYYANTSLFDATRGGGVSFIWSGLWQAKETLKKGFKWILGDRKTIRSFDDPWVRGTDNFMVDCVNVAHDRGINVYDLFHPDTNQWDVHKENNIFLDCDAKAIFPVPIPKDQAPDHMAWVHISDGKYTVKSSYHYRNRHFSDCKHVLVHKGWSTLWKFKVPHKVRVFLWRLCRYNIPVHFLLRSRGVYTKIMCPMCGNDVEHLLHIFLDCPFAKGYWTIMNLEFNVAAVESCPEWVLQLLATEPW